MATGARSGTAYRTDEILAARIVMVVPATLHTEGEAEVRLIAGDPGCEYGFRLHGRRVALDPVTQSRPIPWRA